MSAPRNPFKFLDAYEAEDRDIFFGREKEVQQLYSRLSYNDILLVYGVSGCGKTSLLKCGLASRFMEELPDGAMMSNWLPVFVRRGENIKASTIRQLQRNLPEEMKREPVKDLQALTEQLFLAYRRDIHIIFDQLEELFIFGNEQEREDFTQMLLALQQAGHCKVILSIREEYLAHLSELEKRLPDLFDNRIRIEKFSGSRAKELIEGPCRVCGVELEEGVADGIVENLAKKGGMLELTWLQVVMDRLYREAREADPKKIKITGKLVEKTGRLEDVLGAFLNSRISNSANPEETEAVLKCFISPEATKKQLSLAEIKNEIRNFIPTAHKPGKKEFEKSTSLEKDEQRLNGILQELVNGRILREQDEEGRYELRHDSLAEKIYERFSLAEKEMLEVKRFLDFAWQSYQSRGKYLTKDDLDYLAPYEQKIALENRIVHLIAESKRKIAQAKRRKRNVFIAGSTALLLIMAAFTYWAVQERTKALDEKQKARALYYNILSDEIEKTDPTKALRVVEYAYSLDSSNKLIYENLMRTYHENSFYKTLINKTGIETMCVSSDNKWIITASMDSVIQLWNMDGILVEKYNIKDKSSINTIKFSNDSKSFLVSYSNNTLCMYDLEGNLINMFTGHENPITCFSFSPDGKNLVAGDKYGEITLWMKNGNLKQKYLGHESAINSVTFSPDGKCFLSGSMDGTARIWDLEGDNLHILSDHRYSINTVCYSKEGSFILTGSSDGTAKLYDTGDFSSKEIIEKSNGITTTNFSACGEFILIGSRDNTIKILNISGDIINELKGHKDDIMYAIFSNDGKSVISGSKDNTIRIWDIESALLKVLTKENSNINSLNFSPDGMSIIIGTENHAAKIIDTNGITKKTLIGHKEAIMSVCFSPDGNLVLTGSRDATARLWNINGDLQQVLIGHRYGITYVDFSPKDTLLLTCSFLDGTIKLWNLKGNNITTISNDRYSFGSASFSQDGELIITGTAGDNLIKIYDLQGNLLNSTINGHNDNILTLDISQNNKYILSGSWDKTVKLWDFQGKMIQIFQGHSGWINSVCFMNQGRSIVTCSSDNTARMWNMDGNVMRIFSNHKTSLWSVDVAPNGKSIVTGSSDGIVSMNFIKQSYDVFKNYDNFQKLCVSEKLELGIEDFNTIINNDSYKCLAEAGDYYYNKRSESLGSINYQRNLENAAKLYTKVLNHDIEIQTALQYLHTIVLLDNIKHSKKRIKQAGKIIKKLEKINNNNAIVITDYYFMLSELDSLKKFHFNKEIRQILQFSINCNNKTSNTNYRIATKSSNYSYYMIKRKDFIEALLYAELAKEAFPYLTILYTNLALSYLFTDQWEEAEKIYITYQDSTYNNGNRYCRDGFLEDLDELESLGITHPDFAKARALLEAKENED